MTKIIAVNKNRDIYAGPDGRLAMRSGIDAVLQACEHAAYAQLGEMVLNKDQGIPDFNVIWNGNPNLAQFEASLRTAWLRVDGVVSVVEFSAQNARGVVTYRATIETAYGQGVVSAEL